MTFIATFIVTAIAVLLYNYLAPRIGGIKLELDKFDIFSLIKIIREIISTEEVKQNAQLSGRDASAWYYHCNRYPIQHSFTYMLG